MRRRDDHDRSSNLLCTVLVFVTDIALSVAQFRTRIRESRKDRKRRREFAERLAKARVVVRHRKDNPAAIERITITYA